jgi:hypothetical protein
MIDSKIDLITVHYLFVHNLTSKKNGITKIFTRRQH